MTELRAPGMPRPVTGPAYLGRTRRMLLDMHIPQWDERFLRDHDPDRLADCYVSAGVDAVMMYCKSHLGLLYWPSDTGNQHRGLGGRDAVGDLLDALRRRDIAVCGYTSVAIDRDAAEQHPEWLISPTRSVDGIPEVSWFRRHSALCMNKLEYLDYEKRQIGDLLTTHTFDAFFLDMMFWGAVCACADCTRRFADEDGQRIPEAVDWSDPTWNAFVAARERWADEFSQELLRHARTITDVPVYQNFAGSFFGWQFGKPVTSYRNDSFLGGDLYGGPSEQLLACKLMLSLSPAHPPEYMTSRAPDLRDHVSIKTETQMTLQMFGATALSCAVLFIDAIDPSGSVNPAVYEQVGRVYERRKPYENALGGRHVEDVGVYYSSESLVRLADDGSALADLPFAAGSPHLTAAIGAMQALQELHVPAGAVTSAQLDTLSDFAVIVLPDVTRLSEREAQAFRDYVEAGGRLYASGRTGILSTEGAVDTPLLADLLGVDVVGDDDGPEISLAPASALVESAIFPQRHVSWPRREQATVPPRVQARTGTVTLAALCLPYAYPEPGTRLDQNWSSNYSFPPWSTTAHPVVTERATGRGRAVFSAFPLETGGQPARSLLKALLADLIGDAARVSADAAGTVWIETFAQPEHGRWVVSVLNYAPDAVGLPTPVTFRVRLPAGTSLARVNPVRADGQVTVRKLECGLAEVTTTIDTFAMFAIEYQPRAAVDS